MKLDNKVILVTGASSGIGRTTAIAMAKPTNTLAIVARRKDLLDDAAKLIREAGARCLVFSGDALDESFAEEVVGSIIEQCGKVDLALLNIGIGPPSNTLTASAASIKHCMRANYDTMINFFCPLIHWMKSSPEPSMIAHVNSQASFFGIPMQGDYTAAKGAARLFLETARMELRHFGYRQIKIQTIHPGFVDTEACRGDGVPEPGVISEERAAEYIIKGLERESKENIFPRLMSLATGFGRHAPEVLRSRILLGQTPKEY